MAVSAAIWDASTFNALPSFEEAGPRFDKFNGMELVRQEMQPIYQKHKVECFLGLQLLHQHFELEPAERLVDFNGTSCPIALDCTQVLNVVPSVWKVSEERNQIVIHPLEYTLNFGNPERDGLSSLFSDENIDAFLQTYQAFFIEWHAKTIELGIEGLFGLTRHPGIGYPGRMEVSGHRVNINLHPEQAAIFAAGKSREAAWYFDDQFMEDGCRCLCPEFNGKHAGHGSHVITQ